MTTSASTTFSPSRRSTTRSTPCVLGCCGPMLITSSLVSNMAPWRIAGVLTIQESLVTSPWSVLGPASRSRVLFNLRLVPCLPQPQPVERVFHQQLAGSLERIVFSLGKALPVLRHQDPPPIGMASKVDAEHVEDLALEPISGRPDRCHRGKGLILGDLRLDTHSVPMARR